MTIDIDELIALEEKLGGIAVSAPIEGDRPTDDTDEEEDEG